MGAAGVGGIGMGFMAIRRHIGDEGEPVLALLRRAAGSAAVTTRVPAARSA